MRAKLKVVIINVIGFFSVLSANAQCVLDSTDYIVDLNRIKMAYVSMNGMKVTINDNVDISDSSSITNYINTYTVSVYPGKYFLSTPSGSSDSMVQMSNQDYKLIISSDSTVTVRQPEESFDFTMLQHILVENMMEYNLVNVCAKDTSGNRRKMTFTFKPESHFKSFTIVYDTLQYFVHSVDMRFKHATNPASHSYKVIRAMSYSISGVPVPESSPLFLTRTYLKIVDRKLVLVPPFMGFKLLTNIDFQLPPVDDLY